MPKISVGRDEEDREEHGLKGTGVIGKHLVGENHEAHKANPIHFDMARPHVMGIFGKRGTGKCLKPDEKVFTKEHGLKPIKEIFKKASSEGKEKLNENDEELYEWEGPNTVSLNSAKKTSENKIIAAYRKKVNEELFKVETSSGREITVTGEHPLLTINGWENTDNLEEESKIGIPRSIPSDFKTEKLEIPADFEKADYSTRSYRKEDLVSSDGENIQDIHDGSGSFERVVKDAKDKNLIQVENREIKTTAKGKETVEEREASEHYRLGKCKPITLPEKVSPKFAEFMAYLIAEGHEQKLAENKYRIIFANNNKEILRRFKDHGENLFDLEFKQADELTVYCDSLALEKFLEHNGYSPSNKSFEKQIPNFILESPDKVVKRFLRAIFACEANVTDQQIEFTSASRDIVDKISHMLLRYGIVCRISEKEKYASNTEEKKTRTYQQLVISENRNLSRFKKEIGFGIGYKNTKLARITQRKKNTNVDTVPCGSKIRKARTLMDADRPQIADHKQSLKAYEDGKYEPSREKLAEITSALEDHLHKLENLKEKLENNPKIEIVEELIETSGIKWREINSELGYDRTDRRFLEYKKYREDPEKIAKPVLAIFERKHRLKKSKKEIEELKDLSKSNIFWDEIESIKKIDYRGYVYDLTVENDHNFIAGFGGILCHNSYSMGTIIEEIQGSDISQNLSTIVIDPMGIYWSMTRPNDRSPALLDEWDMKPEAFDGQIYIPEGKTREFEEREMPYDDTFTLNPGEFTSNEWAMAFNIDMNSEQGILLERVISKLQDDYGTDFSLDHIVKGVRKFDFPKEVQEGLVNRFKAAKDWGVFGEESSLEKFTQREELSIIDVSVFGEMASGWSVRSLIVGLLAKRILRERMTARRIEEINEMENISKNEMPITWMFIDEAHEFLPAEGKTPATDPLLRWVKVGREPGVSLVLATQQPAKLHPNALSQCDVLLSHKLTAKQDIDALGEIMQTYMRHDIQHYIDALPERTGAGLILDDNSERIYPVQMRPRKSWHAGGTPDAFD